MKIEQKNAPALITLATYFTLARLCFVPCIVLSMMSSAWVLATVFFVLASITDAIDGMLARSRNEVSWIGTLLDPLVDKLMLVTVYAALVYTEFIPVQLPGWFLALVILNELVLIAGAAYWSVFKGAIEISPSRLAKLVGLAQFLFIVWILMCGMVGTAPALVFYGVLVLIAFARVCVLIQYGLRAYTRILS